MDQKEDFYPNYFLECKKRPIIWFSLLLSDYHEQFTVQNSFVQGLYWFILLKLLTFKTPKVLAITEPNFYRTTAECASPALLHQEGNRVWGDLNWLPPALPHPELRNAYSGSRKLKPQNLENGIRGKKKIKWQLDKLQLELSACRILVAQEILLMPKEGQ